MVVRDKIFHVCLIVAVVVGMSSCVPTPQRSLKRAQRYFPDLFEPDTVMVELPPVTTEISCDTIFKYDTVRYALAFMDASKDSVRVEFRTIYKYKDRPIPYAAYRKLSAEDSLNISKSIALTVDCPDTVVTVKPGVVDASGETSLFIRVLPWALLALAAIAGALLLIRRVGDRDRL